MQNDKMTKANVNVSAERVESQFSYACFMLYKRHNVIYRPWDGHNNFG